MGGQCLQSDVRMIEVASSFLLRRMYLVVVVVAGRDRPLTGRRRAIRELNIVSQRTQAKWSVWLTGAAACANPCQCYDRQQLLSTSGLIAYHTTVTFSCFASLKTLIQDVLPAGNLSSGAGSVPLMTVEYLDSQFIVMFLVITRSVSYGLKSGP